MAFGQQVRPPDLGGGLDLYIAEPNLAARQALAATNISFDELGAMEKRPGFIRQIQQRFTNQVTGIIPAFNCARQRFFIIAHANLDIAKF